MAEISEESVLRDLQPIFQEVLDEPALAITRSSTAWNTPNWDSLAQIDIIGAVQSHFGMTFTLKELKGFKEVGDLVDLIVSKLRAATV